MLHVTRFATCYKICYMLQNIIQDATCFKICYTLQNIMQDLLQVTKYYTRCYMLQDSIKIIVCAYHGILVVLRSRGALHGAPGSGDDPVPVVNDPRAEVLSTEGRRGRKAHDERELAGLGHRPAHYAGGRACQKIKV